MAVEQLNRQVAELRQSLEETNSRVEDISNKFDLLHEKMEAARGTTPGGFTPPEGLKVVRLGEEGQREAQKEGPQATKKSPEQLYNRGQDLFMSGRYREARGAFSNLVESFPAHELADNALYWTGESYYSEKDFNNALSSFLLLVKKYPGENKAPDALLKAGYSYMELEKMDRAKDALEELVERYPDSEAAYKAKGTLKKDFYQAQR